MHREICDSAFGPSLGTFVSFYGSEKVDASFAKSPLLGFLPVTDSRIQQTIATIKRELVHEGFVHGWGPPYRMSGMLHPWRAAAGLRIAN